MSASQQRFSRAIMLTAATLAAGALAVGSAVMTAEPAFATTTIDGPIGLGTAAGFSVLGASAVTNTGPSVLAADLGVSPQTSITGFPPGTIVGASHTADPLAAQAQADTGTAYDVAASLTPTSSGLTDLVALDPVPGVYSGGHLSLSGTLRLDGTASSVWVFQAASALTTDPGSTVQLTGGALACNVFWQVGTSATLGVGSSMVGTVMALASISTGTGTTVDGRLLARTGAVTLDTTTFNDSAGCVTAGTVSSSPVITSASPPAAGLDVPYAFTVTASGTPTGTFAVTSGSLAPGLALDRSTGAITGIPTRVGSFAVTITADNGVGPAASGSYALLVTERLAETGVPVAGPFAASGAGLLLGVTMVLLSRRRGTPRHR